MADLDAPITYRGVDLNDLNNLEPGQPLVGYVVNEFRLDPVEGWGYREKRSLRDGYDVSEVFLGMRNITIRGTIYAQTKSDLHDKVRRVRGALTPTMAYNENPNDKGFLPLGFQVPTDDTEGWPAGYIDMVGYARPADQPGFIFVRDTAYGKSDGYSVPYDVRMEMRDPIFYNPVAKTVTISTNVFAGTFDNRGDYGSPLNFIFSASAANTPAKTFVFTGAGTRMTVTIPSAAETRIIRVDAVEKVCTYEANGEQTLRMDLVTFDAGLTWPIIAPGSSQYDWNLVGSLDAVSELVWAEAFL